MKPLLFQALVFLIINSEYWDFRTVVTAMGNQKSSQVCDRVLDDSKQQMFVKLR